jgi:gamma-glutamyl-gamma-aminobutyrate hydrolase PuuD
LKKIFLSQRVDAVAQSNEYRDALDQRWYSLLEELGCIPIPIANNSFVVHSLLEEISPDGIILTGGNTCVAYGGNAPERDIVDDALIAYAVNHQVPLIGVCRGMQSIVCYFGGKLEKVEHHVAVYHKIVGEENRVVNSFHNLAVRELPSQLIPFAQAEDNTIEGIYHKDYPIWGIMWHPERESSFSPVDKEWMKNILRLG